MAAIGHYTTAAIVREVSDLFKVFAADGETNLYPDADIENWIDYFGQPVVDSKLAVHYNTPFDVTAEVEDFDATIKMVTAWIVASLAIGGQVGQFLGRDPEQATALWDKAEKFLDEIIAGKRVLTVGRSESSYQVLTDDDPETRPSTEVFVGDAKDWERVDEERSS